MTINATATDAAGLTPIVDAFRALAGDNNGNDPVNGDPNGRRQIDWDAAPDAVSDPNPFPGDFFNFNAAPRARGIEFQASGSTSGFLLSANAGTVSPPSFGFETDFVPFSPQRLFTPVDGNTFDVLFFDPRNNPGSATTRGLGVIFSDVEVAGVTSMSFFDEDGNLLAQEFASVAGNGGFSFVGVLFDDPDVFRVSIQAGNAPTIGGDDTGNQIDSVVMDDFIFAEPIPIDPVPLPASGYLLLASLMGLGLLGARARRA